MVASRASIFLFGLLSGLSFTVIDLFPFFRMYSSNTATTTMNTTPTATQDFANDPAELSQDIQTKSFSSSTGIPVGKEFVPNNETKSSVVYPDESTRPNRPLNKPLEKMALNVSLNYRRFQPGQDPQFISKITIWGLNSVDTGMLARVDYKRDCPCVCRTAILSPDTVSVWHMLGLQRGDAIFSRFDVTYDQMKHFRAAADKVGAVLVLWSGTEAPVCRGEHRMAVCRLAHHHVSMHPDALVRLSVVHNGMSPGWYFRPRYRDTLPRAAAFVSNPCYEDWKNEGKKQLHQAYSPGKTSRGYWLFGLQKYFPVDIYSVRCGIILPNEEALTRTDINLDYLARASKVAVSSRYQFVLALENKRDKGYVTEKFYQALEARTLPIYNGDRYAETVRPGNHSFLHVDDFLSVKGLATYLWHLVNHTEEYEEYFEWKKHPLRDEFLQSLTESVKIYPILNTGFSEQLEGWVRLKESLQRDQGWEEYGIDSRVDEYIAAMYESANKDPRKEFGLNKLEPWECRLCTKLQSMVPSNENLSS